LSLQTLISCNLHEEFFIYIFTSSQISLTIRSHGFIYLKMICFFFSNLVLVLEVAVLESFWWKHSPNHLGVEENFLINIIRSLTLQINLQLLNGCFMDLSPYFCLEHKWNVFRIQTNTTPQINIMYFCCKNGVPNCWI